MNKNYVLFFVGVVFGCVVGFLVLISMALFYGPISTDSAMSTPVARQGITLIASESPQLVRLTSTPKPTKTSIPTTAPEFGTVRNPIPLGQKMYMVRDQIAEFEITILSVMRGNDAWAKIYSANEFNDPAPEGMEFVIAEIQVIHTGNDSEIVEVNLAHWRIVSNKRYFDWFTSSTCCLSPGLDLALGAGGEGIGLLALPVFVDDQNPLLVFGDKFYFSLK